MTVYVLFEGDEILGVFSTRKLAEDHARAIAGREIRDWSMGSIGTFVVDDEALAVSRDQRVARNSGANL